MRKAIRMVALAASPIYYRTDIYQLIAQDPRIDFTAVFATRQGVIPAKAGFAEPVSWDIDLLSGYESIFLKHATTNPIDGPFMALRDLDIVTALREFDPEVLWVFGYNFLTLQLAAYFQKARRRPLLVREEQNLLNRRSLPRQVAKKVGLRVMLKGARGLYIGSHNKEWFMHYGITEQRLFFTPYSIDNDRLQRESLLLKPKWRQLKEMFGIPAESGPVILAVNRLIPKKEPLLLLEAFKHVRSKYECTLLIVGTGEMESAMRAKIEYDQIRDVVFGGFLNQSQISLAYATADIFVLPSSYDETWGLVVNEAMNFSLPVVVSDRVGSSRDLVRNGQNGFIVASENSAELEFALTSLVGSEAQRRMFGSRSLNLISGWNHAVAAQGVIDAVQDSVGERRWSLAQGD